MDIHAPLSLLGGLTAAQFMQRHWQRKPLLVRQAVADPQSLPGRADILALAARDAVESRLVTAGDDGWRLRHGPFPRRGLPALSQREWTLLVQGVDLHDDRAHRLLRRFDFLPAARLDDLMVSFATDGGGVGPHFDSYDVFLLQTQGRRRWRIGRQKDLRLQEGMPLKLLAHFEPEEEFLLEPGDMLYLPPRYAHDGVAVGECLTASIGFRAPRRSELVRELLPRIADVDADEDGVPAAQAARRDPLYTDPRQPATDTPGAVPRALEDFARESLEAALRDPDAIGRALGEYLTEPAAGVWFDGQDDEGGDEEDAEHGDGPGAGPDADGARFAAGVVLDRRTRMLHDARHVFINGESYRAAGRDAQLMRRLADERRLDGRSLRGASPDARELLESWCDSGWVHPAPRASAEPRMAS
jgi:50S ribosomal protein L16 3-hydroxylase